MAYVALKPCKFAGQIFKIGERVPEEAILPGAASNRKRRKRKRRQEPQQRFLSMFR